MCINESVGRYLVDDQMESYKCIQTGEWMNDFVCLLCSGFQRLESNEEKKVGNTSPTAEPKYLFKKFLYIYRDTWKHHETRPDKEMYAARVQPVVLSTGCF